MNGEGDPPPDFSQPRIWLPFLLVVLIWGSTWLVIHDQLGAGPGRGVPPSWSVTYRFLVAGIAMMGFAAARGLPLWPGARGLGFALLLGLSQFCLNFNFVYRAELSLTSGLVAVLYALLMMPNSLLAWLAFRQPVTPRFLLGSVIAFAGVALLFTHEYRAAHVDPALVLTGIGFSLCGLLAASVSNVMQAADIARRLPMPTMLGWAMLLGAAVDGLWAWWSVGPPVFDPRPSYALGIIYLALIGSVVTFPLYFRLIQQVGAGRAAYNGVAVPVIAMLLSTLFEGYRWSGLAFAGAALSMLGLVVALRSKVVANVVAVETP